MNIISCFFSLCLISLLPCIIHFVYSVREDLTEESWKILSNLNSSFPILPSKRYTCGSLINELDQHGINVTDCTVSRGNLWYRVDDLMTWEQAWRACRTIAGSDLASIHNVDDFNLLRYLFWMPDEDHTANWVGLNDIVHEGDWTWSDGTQVDYTRWLKPMREPNGEKEENCVMYQSQVTGGGCCWADGLLDFRCTYELPALCKLRNLRPVPSSK